MRRSPPALIIAALALCAGLPLETDAQEPTPADSTTLTAATIDDSCAGHEVDELPLDEDIVEPVFDLTDALDSGDSEYPAHATYSQIWHNSKINPYGIRLVDKPDSALIDVSGYCHPVANRITSDFFN